MKPILTTILALTSVSLAAVLTAACSGAPREEDEGVTTSGIAAGAQIWQFNRECGTGETGACPATSTCPDAPPGKACATAYDRCLTPANASGRRKVFKCVPSNFTSWAFNGTCDGAASCTGRTPCVPGQFGIAGTACTTELARCVDGDRVFVCLPGAKDVFVFNSYCGRNGGPACSAVATECPAVPQGVAGLACTPGEACKLSSGDGVTGKIFRCVSR